MLHLPAIVLIVVATAYMYHLHLKENKPRYKGLFIIGLAVIAVAGVGYDFARKYCAVTTDSAVIVEYLEPACEEELLVRNALRVEGFTSDMIDEVSYLRTDDLGTSTWMTSLNDGRIIMTTVDKDGYASVLTAKEDRP